MAAPSSASAAPLSDEDRYFSTNPPPKHLDDHMALVNAFIEKHAKVNRRVVLVTSGGTTVPLEKQTVRFIDNFSAGTRGATSAEHFLDNHAADYAVIFLHRQFSLQPYSRHYSHATHSFLDLLVEAEDGKGVRARDADAADMLSVLRRYQAAGDRLLSLPFVTVTDYLFELRAISRAMHRLGPNGLLYLAAAVSDFFLPPERMSEHKIQSTDINKDKSGDKALGSAAQPDEDEETYDNFDSNPKVPRSKRLVIDLDPVPKFLKSLVDNWSPQSMMISFKLETDPDLLIGKAKGALERYQHHLVIGNILETRKQEVVFVTPADVDWVRLSSAEIAANVEIESLIVPKVIGLHQKHIEAHS